MSRNRVILERIRRALESSGEPPPIQPRRPGDLYMVIAHFHAELDELKRAEQLGAISRAHREERLESMAVTTLVAVAYWLTADLPAPEDPSTAVA